MKRKSVVLLLLIFGLMHSYAQKKDPTVKLFKYGKVDPEEFKTQVSGADSAARGVKLFDVGKIWFEISSKTGNFIYVFERHMRFKVLNKNGYDLADFEIPLYHGNNGGAEDLDFMDAATYNLENGKILISKMLKTAKFSEKHDKNYTVKKFTLPNVKEGSIVEYKYKIKSDYVFNLQDWYFQGSIPNLYSELNMRIPDYYRYKISSRGSAPIFAVKREYVNDSFYIPSSSNSSGGNVIIPTLNVTYLGENIPAIKKENFITTIEDYIAKVEFELSATNFPSNGYKDHSSTWPKIVKDLMEEESFGKFTTKTSYSKTLLPTIIKEEKNQDKKIHLIFDYVKNNLKWNDKHSIYATAPSVKSVFEKKSGNSADINLSLLNLLHQAGIEASPVLLSTRDNGAHPGYPLISKFNNVIVQVKMSDTTHFLDATDKYLTSDVVDYDNLCHQGLKINMDDNTAGWISVEQIKPSKSNIFYSMTLTEDNKLNGTIFLSYNNYAAARRRNRYAHATNEAEYIKEYKSDKPGLDIKSYKIENLDNPDEMLSETMEVSIDDNVEEAGNLAMMMPLFYERTKENPFKLEERNYPVDFAYPIEENFRILIEFPKTWQLEKLPKNGKIKLPDDEASFTFLFATEENRISINSKINIAKSVFSAEEYHSLKELFKIIVEKQAQQIVFKKS